MKEYQINEAEKNALTDIAQRKEEIKREWVKLDHEESNMFNVIASHHGIEADKTQVRMEGNKIIVPDKKKKNSE